jgi:long-chain acyl-CoA synthetase
MFDSAFWRLDNASLPSRWWEVAMLTHSEFLERAVTWFGDDIAIVDSSMERTSTYNEFANEVSELADEFRDGGIGEGERVVLVLRNRVEFPIALYAIYEVGAVPVPLNYRLATENYAVILEDVEPTAVIHSREGSEELRAGLDETNCDPWQIVVNGQADDATFDTGGGIGELPSTKKVNPDQGRPSYILYTSGTTGEPKGVTVTAQTAFDRVREAIVDLGIARETTAIQVSPWFHAGGIDLTVHPTIAVGGTLVATTDWEPRPTAHLVEQWAATHLVGVPSVIQRIASLGCVEQFDFQSLECLFCMGSPLSEDLAKRMMRNLTPRVYNGYGTTETLLDSILRPPSIPDEAGTVGRPSPDKQVRVVTFDPDRSVQPHETVPPCVEGEVIVRGAPVFDYYYGDPTGTGDAFKTGWYYTGDLGKRNEEGYLEIIGRVDDMILSGGELISPISIEDVLEGHEAVSSAVVVGVPDGGLGEVVTAHVVPEEEVTPNELDTYCLSHEGLADYKRPRQYEFVSSVGRTASGKKRRYMYRT